MAPLFSIATDRARLTWSEVRPSLARSEKAAQYSGLLVVRALRREATFQADSWRYSVSGALSDPSLRVGPPLFEESDYRVSVRGLSGHDVTVEHRDPNVLNRFEDDEPGRVEGLVNFHSQIGMSTFRVLVDGQPEFEFDVEVFPSKLDYKSDYDEIVADVHDTLTGLAFEYLRATWQGASGVHAPAPTQIEWLTLLRGVVDELERALWYLSSRPIRGLQTADIVRRADQVRRVDSGLRSFLRRQEQRHAIRGTGADIQIPSRVAERRAQPTLDTSEHRWLALQVKRIRRRIAELIRIEQERSSARSAAIVQELQRLEGRAYRWSQLEPLRAATEPPKAGFASLQLMTAPGYREAYRACMALSLGLRLEGGPLQLSVKDLSLLYEYWCYLALLRIVAQETNAPIDPRVLLEVRQRGLSVLLRQGHESKMPFRLPNDRTLTVRYNPSMGRDALVPQRPDLLLTLEHPDWPPMHLVLDAKYRLDTSKEYTTRYESPGPPEDALNVMHRYRDAILEESDGITRRSVVQAAALFPCCVETESYERGRLWGALGRIGVGAIPLLPGHDQFLRTWLRHWLAHGGWDMADHAIDHVAIARAAQWRRDAADPVLIGALRGENPAEHLAWIVKNRRYYTPLAKSQPRLFAAGAIAFYEPSRMGKQGSKGTVRQFANVTSAEIVRRDQIDTPWTPEQGEVDVVLYALGEFTHLSKPIVNEDQEGLGRRMGARHWSSRLALGRARAIPELFLETEPEWRLYEELRSRNIPFRLRVRPPALMREETLRGRALFVFAGGISVGWMRMAGFVVRDSVGNERTVAQVQDVVAGLPLCP